MKVLFNNVDFNSRSGPNGFGLKLAREFVRMGHDVVSNNPDVCLNFITGFVPGYKNTLRLDGIYFNTSQNWKDQNQPIKKSYDLSEEIVVQSEFNKKLVQEYFGRRENIHVVHNGTDINTIGNIPKAKLESRRENVWLCASSWRPHKRLEENIKYFQIHSNPDDILVIAGSGDLSCLQSVNDPRVKYAGDLEWSSMISLMKASSNFIHLAYLDHCPNVVIDARASGCKIHCSSSGGTKEIAGKQAQVVEEEEWDFRPIELYKPPRLNLANVRENYLSDSVIEIERVAKKYEAIIK